MYSHFCKLFFSRVGWWVCECALIIFTWNTIRLFVLKANGTGVIVDCLVELGIVVFGKG